MKKIFIDPGHGGSDPGAVKGKRTEKDDVLRLSLLIAEELKKQDVEVKLSRTDDKTVPGLNARIKSANTWGADYFISVHRNSAAASATGNEVWVISTATQPTILKARAVLSAVCSIDGLTDRGIKKGAVGYKDYAVNRDTKMPSALLELGFISNDKDNAAFDKCLKDYAKSISKALCEIVGVKYKEFLPGDVNGNGVLDADDARKALRASAGLEKLTDEQKKAADLNGDGKITAGESREILRKSAGLE